MDNPQLLQKAVDLHAAARVLLLSGKTNEALAKLETAIQHLTRAKKGELTVRGQQAIQYKIEDIQKLIDEHSKQIVQNNAINQVPSNTLASQTQNNNTQNTTTTPTYSPAIPPVNHQLNQFIAEGVSFANQAVAEDSKGSLQSAIQYYMLSVQAMNKACQGNEISELAHHLATPDETLQYKLIGQIQKYLDRIHQLQNVLNQATKQIQQPPQTQNTDVSSQAPTSPSFMPPTSTPPTQQQIQPSSLVDSPKIPSNSPVLELNDISNVSISSNDEGATVDELMNAALDAARLENAKQSEFDSEVLNHMILSDVEGMEESEKRALEAELRGIMNSDNTPKEPHKKKGHKKG